MTDGFGNSRTARRDSVLCLGEPRRRRDAGVAAAHPAKARVTPVLPPAPIAQVRSSGGIEKQWTGYNDQNDDIAAVYDGVDPLSSADESNLYFRMRPAAGSPAWIEYQFSTPTRISTAEAYLWTTGDSAGSRTPGASSTRAVTMGAGRRARRIWRDT